MLPCCSLSLPGGTSDQDRHSSSLPTPHQQPCSQPGCEWKSTRGGRRAAAPRGSDPSAPHPRCFPAVIFSRLAAKSSAERAACLAMFTVWLPAPAHRAPAAHHPEQTPAPRWQGPGRTLCLGHLPAHSLGAWHCSGKESTFHCATIPGTTPMGAISHIFIMSIGTAGASPLVSCSPTAPTEFPFNSCQTWSQPWIFCLGNDNPGQANPILPAGEAGLPP